MHDFYHVSLKLILNNSTNQTLVLGGATGGTFAGFYDLPGGRIDIKEFNTPLLEVLKREVEEELGNIEVEIKTKPVAIGRHLIPAKLTEDKKNIHVLYLFFEGKFLNGDIQITDEHSSHKWIDLSQIDINKYFKSGILEGIQMYLDQK